MVVLPTWVSCVALPDRQLCCQALIPQNDLPQKGLFFQCGVGFHASVLDTANLVVQVPSTSQKYTYRGPHIPI